MVRTADNSPWNKEELKHIVNRGRFHPVLAMEKHERALRWLDDQLRMQWHGPTVVVTHHHPSFESLKRSGTDSEFLDDPALWTQCGAAQPLYRVANYASNLDSLLFRHKGSISLWVAGHIHAALDYVQHGVRIVCNPRGAVRKREAKMPVAASSDRDFDPRMILEIPS